MMTPQELTAYWNRHYSVRPVGWRLSHVGVDRWFRFFALPRARQPTDSKADYRLIVQRRNEVLSALFTEGQEMIIVTTHGSNSRDPIQLPKADHPDATFWMTIRLAPPSIDSPAFWGHLYIRPQRWRPGVIDRILRRPERVWGCYYVILNVEEHSAYHPSHFQTDVILKNQADRDLLLDKFAHWIFKPEESEQFKDAQVHIGHDDAGPHEPRPKSEPADLAALDRETIDRINRHRVALGYRPISLKTNIRKYYDVRLNR
jgi:hypothetical protein